MKTRYWLDTEFIEHGLLRPLELLSIGIVCDDGREFYAENRYAHLGYANDWVKANVLPHLEMVKAGDRQRGGGMTPTEIRDAVYDFVSAGEHPPEFWGYFADYDWVLFCGLFGRMVDLPSGWPMLCLDVKQLHLQVGEPQDGPPQPEVEHHALADARWTRDAWQWLATRYSLGVISW